MKIRSFWGRVYMTLTQKRRRKGTEIIFGCINVFLDSQCIISHEDFNWPHFHPLFFLTHLGHAEGGRNYENYLQIQKWLSRGVI